MKRTFIASGLAVGLVAGAGAGLVLQSSGFAGASGLGSPAVVSVSADDGGAGRADRSARLTEVLQPLVDDGTLTPEQLTAVVETLDTALPERGEGRHGRGEGRGHGRGGKGLEAAATALGITRAELRAELSGGATIADVAAAEGVAVQTVIDAMVAEVQAHLDEEVAAGEHTRAEADEKLAEATARITDLVNNGRPDRGAGDGPDTTPAP